MTISRIDSTLPVRKKTLATGFYLATFMLLLTITYILFVVPAYGSMGFRLDVNYIKAVEAVALLFFSYAVIHRHQPVLSGKFLGLFYLFTIPSTLCYFLLADQSRLYTYTFVAGFIITVLVSNMPRNIIMDNKDIFSNSSIIRLGYSIIRVTAAHKWGVSMVLFLITLGTYSSLAAYNGLPTLTALNLSRVYEVRESVVYGHALMGYLISWQANVVNPVLITAGLNKRKSLLIVLGGLLQLLVFLYTGNRAMLFTGPLVLLVYLLISHRVFFRGLLKTFIVTVAGTFSLYVAFGHTLLPSLFIRRVFFVPPQIRRSYFEFFSANPSINMQGTSLGFLWSSPYTEHVATIIGNRYFDGAYANIGFITSSYADFGLLGVLVFAILAGVFLSFLDVLGDGLPAEVVAGIWTVPIYNLNSTRLSTAFLTQGLFVALLVTFLFREQYRQSNRN